MITLGHSAPHWGHIPFALANFLEISWATLVTVEEEYPHDHLQSDDYSGL